MEQMQSAPAAVSCMEQPAVIGMLYVPVQQWENPYDDDTALARGTVFPGLDKPFTGEGTLKK